MASLRWEQRSGSVEQASRIGCHIDNTRISRNRAVRVGGHKSGSVLSQSTARASLDGNNDVVV
ncbi:hypothetical protein OXX79_014500, partial [Metschnikowia pulcherrima]